MVGKNWACDCSLWHDRCVDPQLAHMITDMVAFFTIAGADQL